MQTIIIITVLYFLTAVLCLFYIMLALDGII